jgi:hypothetical protein
LTAGFYNPPASHKNAALLQRFHELLKDTWCEHTVSINKENELASSFLETTLARSVRPRLYNRDHARWKVMLSAQETIDNLPTLVRGSVVDQEDLATERGLLAQKRRQGVQKVLCRVEERHHDGERDVFRLHRSLPLNGVAG